MSMFQLELDWNFLITVLDSKVLSKIKHDDKENLSKNKIR